VLNKEQVWGVRREYSSKVHSKTKRYCQRSTILSGVELSYRSKGKWREAARLNVFSSKELEVGDLFLQRFILEALKNVQFWGNRTVRGAC